MTVNVKFFALGKELIGENQLEMTVPDGATAGELIDQLKEKYPRFAELNSFLVAVNLEYAELNTPLNDGDEIAVIPPVSGG